MQCEEVYWRGRYAQQEAACNALTVQTCCLARPAGPAPELLCCSLSKTASASSLDHAFRDWRTFCGNSGALQRQG